MIEFRKINTDRDRLEAYLNNELSSTELEELEKRLCLEDDLADLFVSIAHHEAIICEWAQFQSGKFEGAFSVAHSQHSWLASLSRKSFLVKITALTLILLCGSAFFFTRQSLVTVLNAEQAVLVNSNNEQITIDLGGNIQQNKQLILSHGSIELLLPTGVKLLIAAPARFELIDKNEINFSQGKLLAIVTTEEGKGFTTHTPGGSVIDLGTIFGVNVDQSGTSSVQVFKGKVELANSSGETTFLSTGKIMRCELRNNTWQESKTLPAKYYEAIQNQTLLPEIVFAGDPGIGILGPDSDQGVSYIMYSATPAEKRFAPISYKGLSWKQLAQHFVVVHYDETAQKWKLQCNEKQLDFQPVSTDLIIARTEPDSKQQDGTWSRKVTPFNGQIGTIHGILFGYKTSDITIRPDWLQGQSNIGEYMLEGTHFVRQP